MRGKTVNEVCDILAGMQGSLTFLVLPAPTSHRNNLRREDTTQVRYYTARILIYLASSRIRNVPYPWTVIFVDLKTRTTNIAVVTLEMKGQMSDRKNICPLTFTI